jgi:O-antigen/teichoic acid export membrane protein
MVPVGKISLAFGPAYSSNAFTLLLVLSLDNVIRGLYLIYIGLIRIQDKLKEMVLFQFISGIATVTLSYWSVGMYGIVGVGYVWLLVQAVLAVVIGIRLSFWFKQSHNTADSSS